jgi:hypothetical protein
MKCFVAMAFDRPDTEQLYNGAICNVLRQRNVDVVRVDRIEHNQNIDDRIIQEIQTADFVIADLTYARPSVYYEAGFAERELPVIYTIRRDHLKPRADDEFGIYRIHFDLQMKNVVDWAPPGDEVFESRLGSRVDLVTAPLWRALEADRGLLAEKAAFQGLAAGAKAKALERVLSEVASRLGLVGASEAQQRLGHKAVLWSRPCYVKAMDGALSIIKMSMYDQKYPFLRVDPHPEYNLNLQHGLAALTAIRECHIAYSFSAVSFAAVCQEMPDFTPSTDRTFLMREEPLNVPVVDARSVGEVYPSIVEVRRDLSEYVKGGTKFPVGFLVSAVPPGISSKRHYGYHFIFGMQLRAVKRRIEFHLIDEVDSETAFGERLKRALISHGFS